MPIKRKLPDKLSELLLVAVRDLEKVEKDELYKVNMSAFHSGTETLWPGHLETHCEVCLAGAVFAKTLNAPIEEPANILFAETSEVYKFVAIDCLRMGRVSTAAQWMQFSQTKCLKAKKFNRLMIPYQDCPKVFKKELRHLASELKKGGL